MTEQVGGFQIPGVCLQAFLSLLSPSPLFLFFALAPNFSRLKHRNLPRKRLLRRLTEFQSQNLAVKNVVLRNFKILRNDPETKHIFHLLISFKRNKNVGNSLVRSAFRSDYQPGTLKCKRTRCKTCPFISNIVKISGPNRPAKITDHFRCTSANVTYCITCTLC